MELPRDSIAVLDSSVLIAMGGPSTDKYQAFERVVMQRDVSVRIPTHVADELGESPKTYTYQRDRLRAAQDAGWLDQAPIDFSNPRVSEAIDRTRKRMLNLSVDDVTEDEIEKTDTVLTGVAYQYAIEQTSHVTVLVSDTIAEQAIDDVLCAMDVGNETAVIEGREFLEDLLDKDFEKRR
ncbi:hypothetical protein EIK79_15050 [Halocatena pleomorpha]|uniref:PIN domain-containing protein n=2 Tax=Halocatena pleomorpha TaxID=1785090 RepID=A0A3P3R719_9EURY|nr:hypothetical protein EIK79_15050 [Halocatena pleomorpha]